MKTRKSSFINWWQVRLKRNRILGISKLLSIILVVLYLLIGNIARATEMSPPIRVHLTIDTIPRDAPIRLTVKCIGYSGFKFIDGILIYQLLDDAGTIVEKETLWKGKSDTIFNKEFIRSINMPMGSKRKINVSMEYTEIPWNKTYESGAKIYVHRMSRWTMYGFSGFIDLELEEWVRDAEERGINVKELCIAEIDAIDPLLAYRLHPHPLYDPSQHMTPPNPQTYEVRPQGSIRIVQDNFKDTVASSTCQIKGLVLSKRTGVPLFGADVKVNGTNINAIVDIDNYLLKNISPGIYDITASFKGYENCTFSQVNIKSGYKYFLNFKLVDSVNTFRQEIIRE